MNAQEGSVVLNFAMYPYLPDVYNDSNEGLKEMIAKEFQSYCRRESLNVTVQLNFIESIDFAYDPDLVAEKFENDDVDIMEIDAIILGEIVDQGILLPIDSNFYPGYNADDYLPVADESLRYKGALYGIPTLVCGNFFVEFAKRAKRKPYLTTEVVDSVSYMEFLLRETSGPMSDRSAVLHTHFRGSWNLPLLYIQLFAIQHPHKDIKDAYCPFRSDEETLNSLRRYINFGIDTDGSNKGQNEYYYNYPEEMVHKMAHSKHTLFNGYTEVSGEVIQDSKVSGLSVKKIINVAAYSRHITYTDAVVVNRRVLGNEQKVAAVKAFLKFYTSLDVRKLVTLGEGPQNDPRYLMPARKDFYETSEADQIYRKIFSLFQLYSVAAPNHGLYHKLPYMNEALEASLGMYKCSCK